MQTTITFCLKPISAIALLTRPITIAKACLCVVLVLTLTACKSELYGALSEQEGNEMYAILKSAGIDVEKKTGKDQVITLIVDDHQIARSIMLLKNHGYPKKKFLTMNDVFPKDGVISSPTEEKARYIYAMSQDISSTLSHIDGVLVARVHVVLPEKKKFADETQPSSASVFLKYSVDATLDTLVPQIKMLVANSIQGLHYDNVSVALFPSSPEDTTKNIATIKKVLFLKLAEDSVAYFYLALAAVVLALITAIGALIHNLYQQRQSMAMTNNE